MTMYTPGPWCHEDGYIFGPDGAPLARVVLYDDGTKVAKGDTCPECGALLASDYPAAVDQHYAECSMLTPAGAAG